MGYEANEQPKVSATIYYYDKGHCSSVKFCETVVSALKKYGYFDVTNIELGKHKVVHGILKDYAVRYSRKDMSEIDLHEEIFKWVNDDEITYISLIHKERRHLIWDITWHKNYTMPDGVSVSDYMFNHFVIRSSYERFELTGVQDAYIGLFCDLSDAFEAFYGRIEDISTSVDVWDRTKEKCFNPGRIQTVFWGNYLGEKYCSDIGRAKLNSIPCGKIKATDKGVFFRLTDSIFDSKNDPDYRLRKRIYKHLMK